VGAVDRKGGDQSRLSHILGRVEPNRLPAAVALQLQATPRERSVHSSSMRHAASRAPQSGGCHWPHMSRPRLRSEAPGGVCVTNLSPESAQHSPPSFNRMRVAWIHCVSNCWRRTGLRNMLDSARPRRNRSSRHLRHVAGDCSARRNRDDSTRSLSLRGERSAFRRARAGLRRSRQRPTARTPPDTPGRCTQWPDAPSC
jgi:hypothetical protein